MRKSYKRKVVQPVKQTWILNRLITAPELFIIGEDGKGLGVMSTAKALELADSQGLDVVMVNPTNVPPAAKMVNFKQFKYQQNKLLQKQKSKQKIIDTKCLRLSMRIGIKDLEVRSKQVAKFIESGHKVRIELLLKGRERQHADIAKEVISKFITGIENIDTEQPLKLESNKFSVIIKKKS